ncbi:hypothetical protein GQ43DRAFT_480892 [Delitschia confertaspora ATCC 74209]|uniref:Uncharacterized protein n=1 Tax=Delitschia confertaspora ATCC 74209 TaxID=1513339 RepID=A0A9P4JKW3_9PLEO|nr:hypothetical protein GQ43DRAFT_480892 [Delitschia confertaspora ATCC 74209]
MLLQVLSLLLLLTTISTSAPAGSKHNIYLTRCEPDGCPIGICDPGEFTLTAATLFRNGPVTPTTGSRVSTPDAIGKLSGYNPGFEGSSTKSVRLGRDGTFSWNITTGSNKLTKGALVGDGALGTEPFACFRDGSTKFAIREDGDRYSCTAEYWCGSLDVSALATAV